MNPEKKFLVAGVLLFVLFAVFVRADPYYDFYYGFTGFAVLETANETNTTGSIYGYTTPSDAQMYVDYSYYGQTPLTVSNLLAGSHYVQFKKSGYQDFYGTYTVYSGQTTNVFANLVPSNTTSPSPTPYPSPSPNATSSPSPSPSVQVSLGPTPQIFNVGCPEITSGSIRVIWNTDIASDSAVTYLSNGYYEPATVTSHSVLMTGLPASTRITFYTKSCAMGRCATQGPNSCTTHSAVNQSNVTDTGAVSIRSYPAGAKVYFDNIYRGVTSPDFALVLPYTPVGRHNILLIKDGYYIYSAYPYVYSSQTANVNAYLSPLPGYANVTPSPSPSAQPNETGYIYATSTPPGASVHVDSVFRGYTPVTLSVPAGLHNVMFSLPGYQTTSNNLYVTSGQTTSIHAVLVLANSTPSPSPSTMPSPSPNATGPVIFNVACPEITSSSIRVIWNTDIYSDSAALWGSQAFTNPAIVTSHAVMMTGLPSSTRITFNVRSCANGICTTKGPNGCTTHSATNLTNQTNLTGSIYGYTNPVQAEMYLDNAFRGLTPLTVNGVAAGSHNVLFVKNGYYTYSAYPYVAAYQTTTVSANLVPLTATVSPSPSAYPSPSPSVQPNNTCYDSDGGFNIYVKGTVSGSVGGIPYSHTDFCYDAFLLNEHYCGYPDYAYNSTVNCGMNGTMTCSDGRCISNTNPSPSPSASPMPSPSPTPGPSYEMNTYVHDDLDYNYDAYRFTTETSRFGPGTSSFGSNLGPKMLTKEQTYILAPAPGLSTDGKIIYPTGAVNTYENQRVYLFAYTAYDETVKQMQAKYAKTGYEAIFETAMPLCLDTAYSYSTCPSKDKKLWAGYVELTFLGEKYGVADYYAQAGQISSVTLGKYVTYKELFYIGEQVTTPDSYVVKLTDIGTFQPIGAQFDVLDANGNLIKRVYGAVGDRILVTEAGDLVIYVYDIPDASSAAVYMYAHQLIIGNNLEVVGGDSHKNWIGKIVTSTVGSSEAISKIQLYNDIDQTYKVPITQTLDVGEGIDIIKGKNGFRFNFLGLQSVDYDTLSFTIFKNKALYVYDGLNGSYYTQPANLLRIESGVPNAFQFGSTAVPSVYWVLETNSDGSLVAGDVYYMTAGGYYAKDIGNYYRLTYYYSPDQSAVLYMNPQNASSVGIFIPEITEENNGTQAYYSNNWHLNLQYDSNLDQFVDYPGYTSVQRIGYSFGPSIIYANKELGFISYRGTSFNSISSFSALLAYPKQVVKARYALTSTIPASSSGGGGGGGATAVPTATSTPKAVTVNPTAVTKPIEPIDPVSAFLRSIANFFGFS
ncbi:MAG: PEGA domain-containing protein [Candidatus Micrarchaeota archaeon]